MKKILRIVFLIIGVVLYSQEKEITIIDKNTRLPISQVNIFYKELNEGVLTNEDGKAKIHIKESDLSVSHLSYINVLIPTEKTAFLNDTLWLTPKITMLEEVVVQNTNLKKKLKYVLDNYNDLYIDYPTEKECSIKETFLFDNNYKRLFSAELKWWSKGFYYKFIIKPSAFTKLSLGKIDYFKNVYANLADEKQGFAIITKTIIPSFYLNSIISKLLKSIDQTNSFIENKDSAYTTISYTTDWITIKNGVTYQRTGEITFDNETMAIVKLSDSKIYKDKKETARITRKNGTAICYTSRDNKEYIFIKNKEGRWGITYFNVSLDGFVDYDNIMHTITLSNSLYVLKETKAKKSSVKESIDLNKPIYKNLPSEKIINTNSILLTEKEMNFIKRKN